MYLQIRQRDVVLQFSTQGKRPVPSGTNVRIEQIRRSFPLGSCINRWSLDNSSYKKFFLENFNWAVFENEIKWGWTEPQQDTVNISTSWIWVMGICVASNTSLHVAAMYALGSVGKHAQL